MKFPFFLLVCVISLYLSAKLSKTEMEKLKEFSLRSSLLENLDKFGIKQLSQVQTQSIPAFLARKDVVVQSPTGSGKTLAYSLPMLEIILRANQDITKYQVGGLVLVPTRELATQVSEVLRTIQSKYPIFTCTGGRKLEKVIEDFKENGGNVIVATPGRLYQLLFGLHQSHNFKLAGHLKSLEVLILDETDRLLELGFRDKISGILSALPKQRRTGLFSATQATEMEDIVITGLRNRCNIVVSDETAENETASGAEDAENEAEAGNSGAGAQALITPHSLQNFYLTVSTDSKLSTILNMLSSWQAASTKTAVFLSTCAEVQYLAESIKSVAPELNILCLHGKKRKQRPKILAKFGAPDFRGAILCTDVMSRGIHVDDIDWVVQWGVPRTSNWFVHRAGRTGRGGREGRAVILLAQESEDAYPDYIHKHSGVTLLPFDENLVEKFDAESVTEQLRQKAEKDRAFLELGTRAFVSYIQAYCKLDCKFICNLKELDVVGVLHCLGLLRVPKMWELCRRDLSGFRRSAVNTATIKYTNKKRERQRQQKLIVRTEENRQRHNQKSSSDDVNNNDVEGKRKRKANKEDKTKEDAGGNDWEDDYKLMKKLKKGRLSKKEFDLCFGND